MAELNLTRSTQKRASNIPDSNGDSQHKEVFKLLEEWNIVENIVGAVFDTTSSNSGRWKGSVTLIERRLNHHIFWLACRHHVYELHIKHVAEVVMGKRNSPSEGLFLRFQKEWDDFEKDKNDLCLFNNSEVFAVIILNLCRIFISLIRFLKTSK